MHRMEYGMKKAVIFDLFETLVTEWGHEKYTKQAMCEDLGIDTKAFSLLWEEQTYKKYKGQLTFEESMQDILSKLGVSVPTETLNALIKKRYETKSVCFDEAYINPEIFQILTNLKEKGIKLGLVSNCSSEELQLFRESKLYSFFDVTIMSYLIGYAKPELEIYQAALKELALSPDDCLYVGDGGSNELMGASKVGMKALQAVWYKKQFVTQYANTGGFPILHEPKEVFNYISE